MNYGELKSQIATWAHRNDFTAVIPSFVEQVTQRLNRRFGITLTPLVNDVDTNLILDNNPTLYLYGCLRQGAIYTHDQPATEAYNALYNIEVDRMNITYAAEEWNTTPPVVEPYESETV